MTNHIAQMNWGRLLHDWEDPRVAGFVDNIDRVNAIADRSAGFVWRMTDDDMENAQLDETGIFGGDARVASTLSVWESATAISDFVYKTVHGGFVKRGEEWFENSDTPRYVIWNVEAGHRPTMQEAKVRIDLLAAHGPGPDAYTFGYMQEMAV